MTTGSSSSRLASHQQPHLQVLCLVLLQRPLTARDAWTSGKDFGGVCASASMHFFGVMLSIHVWSTLYSVFKWPMCPGESGEKAPKFCP